MEVDGNTTAPRWLSDQEMATWMGIVRLMVELPQALDRQLRTDAKIGHVYYQILAHLSDAPDHQRRMSELARVTGTSASRLSHAVSALEERGWVTRCKVDADGRGQLARLTAEGLRMMERTAPGHVDEVRRLVFDRLSTQEVEQLGDILAKIGLTPDGATRPPTGRRP